MEKKKIEKKKLFLLLGVLAILLVGLFFIFSENFFKEAPLEDDLNGERVYCEDSQRDAEFCTMEYDPVCGNDLETYSNPCFACMDLDVEYYVPGEC